MVVILLHKHFLMEVYHFPHALKIPMLGSYPKSTESDSLGRGLGISPFNKPRWFSRAVRFEICQPCTPLGGWCQGPWDCLACVQVWIETEWAWPVCLTYSVGVGVLILLVSSRLKDFFILPVQNHTLKVTVTCVFPMTHLFTLLKND